MWPQTLPSLLSVFQLYHPYQECLGLDCVSTQPPIPRRFGFGLRSNSTTPNKKAWLWAAFQLYHPFQEGFDLGCVPMTSPPLRRFGCGHYKASIPCSEIELSLAPLYQCWYDHHGEKQINIAMYWHSCHVNEVEANSSYSWTLC